MKLPGFKPFDGQHCETTATGTLLLQAGVTLSEPMLFGLGEGLAFIYWKMKSMPCPFLGGRVRPDMLTRDLTRNLGIALHVRESSSATKAWEGVRAELDAGRAVGLKLDSYYLEYFGHPIHFAGHYVAIYGYDTHQAFLVDTAQQGGRVTTSLASLARARAAKGPMASRSLWYVVDPPPRPPNLRQAVPAAIRANAETYLRAPIANLGWRGIAKAARELPKWWKNSRNRAEEFGTAALLMERAGTGGALFRNLYRDFLGEAHALLGTAALGKAHHAFVDIAAQWTKVAGLLAQAGHEREGSAEAVAEAARVLVDLSEREKTAMATLT